ncbi:MAG: hypothetical protein IJ491_01290 [Clostridia bacterium]|nr:hypothetical protein [Clostridia bacterium]
MIVAIVGSRSLEMAIPEGIIPENTSQIISGGARGIDISARKYALSHRIQITEILPEYDLYGRAAPLKRNDWIIRLSDAVYVFWDGKSHGANYMIRESRKAGKAVYVYLWNGKEFELME